MKKYKMIDGVLLLNKPKGITANQALQQARRFLQAEKAGHSGTLDPMATGMLPICCGRATKLIEYMLDADKAYRATLKLGAATDTGDAEGEIILQKPVPSLTEMSIEAVLNGFRGAILQVPPMYSAIKHQGQRLYTLARQGVEIERQARQVNIYQLTLVEYGDDYLVLEVLCSKGTYIRTLGEDIALALGTCGHLTALHRLYCAGFQDHSMMTLHSLETETEVQRLSHILPIDAGLQHYPQIEISKEIEKQLLQGKTTKMVTELQGKVRLYQNERLIAIAEICDNTIVDRKFIHTG